MTDHRMGWPAAAIIYTDPAIEPPAVRLYRPRRPTPAPVVAQEAAERFEHGDFAAPVVAPVVAPAEIGTAIDEAVCAVMSWPEATWHRVKEWECRTGRLLEGQPAEIIIAWAALPEDGDWRLHLPGDPMPCSPEERISAWWEAGLETLCIGYEAKSFPWGVSSIINNLIAWRPA